MTKKFSEYADDVSISVDPTTTQFKTGEGIAFEGIFHDKMGDGEPSRFILRLSEKPDVPYQVSWIDGTPAELSDIEASELLLDALHFPAEQDNVIWEMRDGQNYHDRTVDMTTLENLHNEYRYVTEAELEDFADNLVFNTSQVLVEEHQNTEFIRFTGTITPHVLGEEPCEFNLNLILDEFGQTKEAELDFLDALPSASQECSIPPNEEHAKKVILAELLNPASNVELIDEEDNAVTQETLSDLAQLAWMKKHGYGDEVDLEKKGEFERILTARVGKNMADDILNHHDELSDSQSLLQPERGRYR